jgi:aconitase B
MYEVNGVDLLIHVFGHTSSVREPVDRENHIDIANYFLASSAE